jgi:hypothetical protein
VAHHHHRHLFGERKKPGEIEVGHQSLEIALHQKSSPDHGANAHQHDLELIDDGGRHLRHTVSLPDLIEIYPGFFRSQTQARIRAFQ